MNTDIRAQVARVARLRAATTEATEQLATLRARFNEEHATLIEDVAIRRTDLETAEKALKEAAVAHYLRTDDKAPAPGVTVKMFRVAVYDPETAMAWARQHGLCLTLDSKAFEKIAKAGLVDCATVRDEPVVTLAANLDAALELEAALAEKD